MLLASLLRFIRCVLSSWCLYSRCVFRYWEIKDVILGALYHLKLWYSMKLGNDLESMIYLKVSLFVWPSLQLPFFGTILDAFLWAEFFTISSSLLLQFLVILKAWVSSFKVIRDLDQARFFLVFLVPFWFCALFTWVVRIHQLLGIQ